MDSGSGWDGTMTAKVDASARYGLSSRPWSGRLGDTLGPGDDVGGGGFARCSFFPVPARVSPLEGLEGAQSLSGTLSIPRSLVPNGREGRGG